MGGTSYYSHILRKGESKAKAHKEDPKYINVLDFDCQHVLKFLDHCESCAKREKCRYRDILSKILSGKMEIVGIKDE